MLSSTLIYRAQLALRRGDLAEAEDDLRALRELTPYDDTHRGPAYWYAFLAEALLERGDVDGAAAGLAELDPRTRRPRRTSSTSSTLGPGSRECGTSSTAPGRISSKSAAPPRRTAS